MDAALNPNVSNEDSTPAISDVEQHQTSPTRSDTPIVAVHHTEDATNGISHVEEDQITAPAPSIPIATSKKRKLAELGSSRSRSTSRAASPPWKAFSAEGPTQFTADGKRRSGRVNHVPLEQQAASDRRQTRAAHETTLQTRVEKHDNDRRSSRGTAGPTVKREVRSSLAAKEAQNGLAHSPTKGTPDATAKVTSETPSVKVKNTINGTLKGEQEDALTETPERRRPGRPSNASKQLKTDLSEQQMDGTIDVKPNTTSNEPHRSPRIRLKFRQQVIAPRHPDFIPKESKFSSLEDTLAYYDQVEKEQGNTDRNTTALDELERRTTERTKLSPEQLAWKEAQSRIRILDASKPGGVLTEEKCSIYFPDVQEKPPPRYGHFDHLWTHGAYFRLLMDREKARHIELAKKTAEACLVRWEETRPQTEAELEKEQEEIFRLIYKQTVKDLQRKWELVSGEIEKRRLAQWIEDQELTRDRNMQKLLEKATAMLDQRRLGHDLDSPSVGVDTSDDEDDDEDANSNGSGRDDSESDDNDDEDDDNMSSSESEEDDKDSLAEADEDMNLSPEALKAKYSAIPAPQEDEDAMQLDQESNDNLEESSEKDHGLDVSGVALEDVDDALLDDDDDSTDMSDDMGSSDDEDDSGDEASDEGQSDPAEDDDVGLLGFLGGRERKLVQLEENDDDEDKMDETPDELTQLATPSKEPHDEQALAPVVASPSGTSLLVTSPEGDHDSQPTPLDDTTAEPTEADSYTSIDADETTKSVKSSEATPQPLGSITTKVPSLLRGTLREYQHYGLDWLAKLYENDTNGILADEMGLGKTIQTIALLAHLAEEHHVWGPHLIVVPTSVILNWEMEFKKFLPGFKVLSYYGNTEERLAKRKGWSNPDNYNVVITSYQLVLKDLNAIKVPEWHYMILDEAHNIKNFQSQRYRAMIRLKTHARLLLTGTPLQNSIQELWSLLTFLTAGQDGQGMGDLDDFIKWFARPVNEIFVDGKNKLGTEAQAVVDKLHHSLRPYILRRMKAQVEQQLPGKYEHTLFCRLSKRQRQLYDAFLGRTDVKEKLSSGNPISVSQALIALRKVCNHPDLFEERPILTSFTMRKPWSKMPRSIAADFEIKDLMLRKKLVSEEDTYRSEMISRIFNLTGREKNSRYHVKRSSQLRASGYLRRAIHGHPDAPTLNGSSVHSIIAYQNQLLETDRIGKLKKYALLTDQRTAAVPVFGRDLVERCTVYTSDRIRLLRPRTLYQPDPMLLTSFRDFSYLPDMVKSVDQRSTMFNTAIQKFGCITPNAVAHDLLRYMAPRQVMTAVQSSSKSSEPDAFHESRIRLSIAFPDKRLLQYDCGKLQQLAILLRQLQTKGSRALIFTQMTSVLDILERFLNIHGYRYLRLDGSTKIEQRQDMMERFNRDTRIDVFILSSRSGGVGMNLTGADTVIFYDLDWNPQMDKQCQDRAHRIGQTRDVHIYKLVSEHTIEVNILKKSNQKRMLDEVVIQEGEFTTDYFNRPGDVDDGMAGDDVAGAAVDRVFGGRGDVTKVLEAAEDTIDVEAARTLQKDLQLDDADFNEEAKARSTVNTSVPTTPAPTAGDGIGRAVISADGTEMSTTLEAAQSGLAAPFDVNGGIEDERPHIDDYMLRFAQDVLRHVPFVPPVDKTKRGRLDKNGRDRSHRPKKR